MAMNYSPKYKEFATATDINGNKVITQFDKITSKGDIFVWKAFAKDRSFFINGHRALGTTDKYVSWRPATEPEIEILKIGKDLVKPINLTGIKNDDVIFVKTVQDETSLCLVYKIESDKIRVTYKCITNPDDNKHFFKYTYFNLDNIVEVRKATPKEIKQFNDMLFTY